MGPISTKFDRLGAGPLKEGLCIHLFQDLKAQNILIDAAGNPIFLDLEGLYPARKVEANKMARDLMRLNASFGPSGPVPLKDRLRFLKVYARARGLGPRTRKMVRNQILRRTQAKWAQWEQIAR